VFSKKTYAFSILLVISASFTFQIYKFFEITFGVNLIKLTIYTCFVIVAICLIVYGIKIRPDFLQIIFIALAFFLSLVLIICLPFLAEKTHILSYGLLGYMATNDLYKTKNSPLKSVLLAFTFGLFINISDEIFQAVLPYRFGEIRDIITNIVCTVIGILIFFGFNERKIIK